jgi:protease I
MKLAGKRVAILIADGVEDLEYYVPLMRLKEEGAEVSTAALDLKTIHGKGGLEIKPDIEIEQLHPKNLDGLLLPGGWAPDKLRRYAVVKELVKQMDADGRIIGVICHGGLIAISAGIVRGKKTTGSLGIKDDLENAGGIWVDQPAFTQGNQVWGRIVADIPDFCRELIVAFTK